MPTEPDGPGLLRDPGLRVVVVASNASTVFGGEAILPWHYFRLLRARSVDVHLVTHERNRADLQSQPEMDDARVHFVADTAVSRVLQRWGDFLPSALRPLTVWPLMGVIGDVGLRRQVRRLTFQAPGPVVVHEPVPVAPKQPSLMSEVGGPLVVGPLNGGMEYPAGFRQEVSRSERLLRRLLRSLSGLASRVARGRVRASLVLVANERSRLALPRQVQQVRCETMPENGVDLTMFPMARADSLGDDRRRFVYLGRLVDWKRVDLVIRATAALPESYRLDIVGDGPMAARLQQLVAELGIEDRVTFHGLRNQPYCAEILRRSVALVLPSIYECGGAVVLEAMATGRPVIATNWGGPADYVVDGETGILVDPMSPQVLTDGFAQAMARLGESPALASTLGAAGRRRVEDEYDWERKTDRILQLYLEVAGGSPGD